MFVKKIYKQLMNKAFEKTNSYYKIAKTNFSESARKFEESKCTDEEFENDMRYWREEIENIENGFWVVAEDRMEHMSEEEFNEIYYKESGKEIFDKQKQEIDELVKVYNEVNNIIENYPKVFLNISREDYEKYIKIWNKYFVGKYKTPYSKKVLVINEEKIDIDKSYKCIDEIRYKNKIYEVYKFETTDSEFYDSVHAYSIKENKYITYTNKYLKLLEDRPIDKISYKRKIYEVYPYEVENSVFYNRVKAKSLIHDKVKDFKKKYLKEINYSLD